MRRKLYLGLVCAMALSLYLVISAGHGLYALAMVLPTAYCLWKLYKEPLCDATVGWRAGQWLIFYRGQLTAVELRRGWVCLSWLVQLRLHDPLSGRCYALLLFPDSAEGEALRRLRRRLSLEQ